MLLVDGGDEGRGAPHARGRALSMSQCQKRMSDTTKVYNLQVLTLP
jgi:hypothetical protein